MTSKIANIDGTPEVRDVQGRAQAQEFVPTKDVIDALDVALVLYDVDLNFVSCNEKYCEVFSSGQGPATEVGENISTEMGRLMAAGLHAVPNTMSKQDFMDAMIDHIKSYAKDVPVETDSGLVLSVSVHKPATQGYLLAFSDITEQHRAKMDLERRCAEAEQANARYQEALEALDDGLALWDSDLRFVMANQRSLDMLYPGDIEKPKLGDSFQMLVERQARAGVYSIPEGMSFEDISNGWIAATQTHQKGVDLGLADGMFLEASSHKTTFDGYLHVFKDVTEKHLAEENRLATVNDVIQTLDIGLVLWDSEMNFVMNNDKHIAMFHADNPVPEVGENLGDIMQRLLADGFFKVPKGVPDEVYIDTCLSVIKKYQKNTMMMMADGRIYNSSIHKTALGGYLNAFTDITEQRKTEAELERQREITHQNEKLSALGELLAGVAHELNNPLSIVVGYAQMLEGRFDDPVLNTRVSRISQAADRSAKIVKTFLAMARQRPTKIEQCSLNEAVLMALEMAGYGLRSNGNQIILDFDDNLPLVSADIDQLAQVFTNLIVNAEHALADKSQDGRLELRSYYDKKTDHSVVEVRDNGSGIASDIQAQIFEPFFTTKDVGSGTGIGLAFCHRIIDTHGGFLTVQSKVGKGTSFFVQLRSVENKLLSQEATVSATTNHTVYNILVVDDEEGVAELVCDLLQDKGHAVIVSTDARESLKLMKQRSFDVILSDFKMPGLDGAGFFQIIQEEMPHYAQRIGFITGDAMGKKVASFFDDTRRPYIEKPISTHELIELVNRLGGEIK